MLPRSADVVVYETKPATEWLLGGPVQKVSPRFRHSVMQRELSTRLGTWARGRGRVGPEWRFWLQPPGEQARYLVPDVAYLSYERLSRESRDDAEEPRIAPDVAFEVLSPGDQAHHLAHKIEVYLRAGTLLVVIVDPANRVVRVVDNGSDNALSDGQSFEHSALPGFSFALDDLFAALDE
jgi:Uma2 family endonuclease